MQGPEITIAIPVTVAQLDDAFRPAYVVPSTTPTRARIQAAQINPGVPDRQRCRRHPILNAQIKPPRFPALDIFRNVKFFTSASILTGNRLASKRATGAAALIPPRTFDQKVSKSLPLGEMTPMPVITTRRSEELIFMAAGFRMAAAQTFLSSRHANGGFP